MSDPHALHERMSLVALAAVAVLFVVAMIAYGRSSGPGVADSFPLSPAAFRSAYAEAPRTDGKDPLSACRPAGASFLACADGSARVALAVRRDGRLSSVVVDGYLSEQAFVARMRVVLLRALLVLGVGATDDDLAPLGIDAAAPLPPGGARTRAMGPVLIECARRPGDEAFAVRCTFYPRA